MAGPISTAYVLIKAKLDPDFSGEINKQVDAEFKKIEAESERASRGISKAFDKAVGSVSRGMGRIDASAKSAFKSVSAAGDKAADDIGRDFQTLQRELQNGLDIEINSDVEVAAKEIRARIEELRSDIDRAIVVDVNANTAAAKAEIASMTAALRLVERHIEISIDADTDAAEAAAESLFAKLLTLGDSSGKSGSSISSFGQLGYAAFIRVGLAAGAALSAIVPIGPTLVGVAAAAVAVAGAVGLAAGSLITAGVAASSLLLAFAALKTGFVGVGDAMKAQSKAQQELAATGEVSAATQEKLDAALKRLSPSAREVVKTLGSVSKEWSKLRRAVQESLFDKQAANVQKLSDVFRPLLQGVLVKVAGTLNEAADSFTNFITEGSRVDAIRTALDGLADILKPMLQGIGNLGAAFGTLFGGAIGEAGDLANSFVAITQRFQDFINRAAASGALADFLDRAGQAAGALLGFLGNLGAVLGGVFGAGASAGVSALDNMSSSLSGLRETIKSVEGQSALAGFFGTMSIAAQAFSDVMGVLRPVLAGIGDIFESIKEPLDGFRTALLPVAETIGQLVGGALSDLGPAFASLIDAAAPLAGVLDNVAKALAPIVGFAIGAIASGIELFASALAKILENEAVATFLSVLGVALGAVALALAGIYAASAVAGVISGIAAAFGLLSLSIAGPVLAIAAIIAGLILAYKHSETFRNIVNTVANVLKTVFLRALEGVQNALGFVKDNIKIILPIITALGVAIALAFAGILAPVAAVIAVIAGIIFAFKNLGKIKEIVSTALAAVGSAFAALPGILLTALAAVGKFLLDVVVFFASLPFKIASALLTVAAYIIASLIIAFQTVVAALPGIISGVIAFFVSLPGLILTALGNLGMTLVTWMTVAFGFLMAAIPVAIKAVLSFFSALPGQILSALSSLGGLLRNLFTAAISAARNAVVSGFTTIINFVRSAPGRIISGLSSLGSLLGGVFSKAFAAARTRVVSGVANIIDAVKGLPGKLVDRIQAGFNAIGNFKGLLADKINSAFGLPKKAFGKTIIPAFANGGVVSKATTALIGEAGKEVVVPLERGSSRIRELVEESGLLNVLSNRDFTALVLPHLQQITGTGEDRRVSSSSSNVSSVSNRSVNIERGAPAQNVRTTVVEANFGLLATTDPDQQAEQIAARLATILDG